MREMRDERLEMREKGDGNEIVCDDKTVPHYFVIKTLGQLFVTWPLQTVHKLKVVLARVLPILSSINKDALQWVVAVAIGQFCAAAMDYVANKGEEGLTLDSIASDVFPAFEILFNKWLKARDKKIVMATLQTVGYIMALLPKAQYETLAAKVALLLLRWPCLSSLPL